MAMTNRIGFIGSYKCDLILYIAQITSAAGKKVAIVDAAGEPVWEYNVPVYLDNRIITYDDIDIYLNCGGSEKYKEIEMDDYDIVLIDYGFNKDMLYSMKQCNSVIIVSTLEKFNVMRLRECLKTITLLSDRGFEKEASGTGAVKDAIKIYRDIVNSKINTDYIDSILDINQKINIVLEYILTLDEIDYKYRLENQYGDSIVFKKLTKSMKNMLMDIVEACTDISRKDIIKAAKKAERGS